MLTVIKSKKIQLKKKVPVTTHKKNVKKPNRTQSNQFDFVTPNRTYSNILIIILFFIEIRFDRSELKIELFYQILIHISSYTVINYDLIA